MSAADARSWVLSADELQRKLVASVVYNSEPGWVVRIEPPRRTGDQNRLLHAVITEAVEAGFATDDGTRLTVDDAKTVFVTGWMGETGQTSEMVIVNGRPIQLRRSTTTFTKGELSSLVDYIRAECFERAQRGKMKPLPESAP